MREVRGEQTPLCQKIQSPNNTKGASNEAPFVLG